MFLYFTLIIFSSFRSGIAETKPGLSSETFTNNEDTCGICIPAVFNLSVDSSNRFYPGGKDLSWYEMKIYSRWGDLVFNGRDN